MTTTSATGARATSSATPTPTPTPTPTVLSDAEAATAYIAAICPANKTVDAVNAALQGTDLNALHQAAQVALTADSTAAKALDTTLWPADVKADVDAVRDDLFSEVAIDGQLVHLTDISQINTIQWPDSTAASQASARLRSRLNLSVDATQGC
ncbi:hypothetical protein [Humibacter soli]